MHIIYCFVRDEFNMSFKPLLSNNFYNLNKVSEVGKMKLSQSSLPTDLNVVRAGGYDNLSKLAADPKSELVTLIINNLRQTSGSGDYQDEGKLDALVALLQAQGKGFSSVNVEGEWSAVLARQGKKSTKSQKFVGKKQKSTSSRSNFNVKAMEFENLVSTPRGNGLLKAIVKVCSLIISYYDYNSFR